VHPLLLLCALACAPAAPTPEDRRAVIDAQTQALVDELQATGNYDCCVKSPCKTCATRQGGCKCGEGLRRGEPVCEECAMMWAMGRGDEPGVDPSSVRSFLEAAREETHTCRCGGGPADPSP